MGLLPGSKQAGCLSTMVLDDKPTLASCQKMSKRRQRKVAELVHRELSGLLKRKMSDPRVQSATITEVQMTPDLRMARVYVTSLGTEKEQKAALKGLQGARGFLRHELATNLSLRCVPELIFFLDNAWESASRIDSLLEEIRNQSSERDEGE